MKLGKGRHLGLLFWGRYEEKWEEDVRMCQLEFLAGHKEQVSKFGFFCSFTRFWRDGLTQKKSKTQTFPQFLAILKGRAYPKNFQNLDFSAVFLEFLRHKLTHEILKTQTFLQFSWDFEGMGSPQKIS